MSDDFTDVAAGHAGDPPPRPRDGMLGRWPTIICDGWIPPNHARRVLRAGDTSDGISYGICPICSAALVAASEHARRRRWRDFLSRSTHAPSTRA